MLRRSFCTTCYKAESVCICGRFPGKVPNETAITILQHPKEKFHPLGSSRIALLGLENVQVIVVPLGKGKKRISSKIPGSKRSLSGRVGSKGRKLPDSASVLSPNLTEANGQIESMHQEKENEPDCAQYSDISFSSELFAGSNSDEEWDDPPQEEPNSPQSSTIAEPRMEIKGDNGHGWMILSDNKANSLSNDGFPTWISLPPGSALLFPSKQAFDLDPALFEEKSESGVCDGGSRGLQMKPTHFIVLDGTWPKAKRVYHQNPWLKQLPHYSLPAVEPSRYGLIRKEPRLGFISTIESIVYALKIVEPELKGLEALLDVFDSMVVDQVNCMDNNPRNKESPSKASNKEQDS